MNALNKELRRLLSEASTTDLDQCADLSLDLKNPSTLKVAEKKALALLFLQRAELLKKENRANENTNQIIILLKNALTLRPQLDDAFFLLMSLTNKAENILFLYDFVENHIHKKTFSAAEHLHFANFYFLCGDAMQSLSSLFQSIQHFKCTEELDPTLISSEVKMLWGHTLFCMALLSEEPADMICVIEFFRKMEAQTGLTLMMSQCIARAFYRLCLIFNDSSYFKMSLDAFEQLLTLDPLNEEGLFFSARLNSLIYEKEKNEKYLRQACAQYQKLSDKPSYKNQDKHFNSALLYYWAKLLIAAAIHEKAMDVFDKAFHLLTTISSEYTDYVDVLCTWAEAELEAVELEEQETEEGEHRQWIRLQSALRKSKKSVEISSNHTQAWSVFGLSKVKIGAYLESSTDVLEGVEHLETALNLDSKNAKAWHALAIAHLILGEEIEPREYFTKAANYCLRAHEYMVEVSAQFYYDWGVILKKLAEETGKIQHADAAVTKLAHAIDLFQQSYPQINVKPEWIAEHCFALNLLGALSGSADYHEQALELLDNALKLNADSTLLRYHYALSWIGLGNATDELDFYQFAMQQFNYLLNKNPQDDRVWHEWGVTLLRAAELIEDPTISSRNELFYKEAESKLMTASQLGYEASYYYLMALYSLKNQIDPAMYYLKKTHDAGILPFPNQLKADLWLDNLIRSDAFQQFYKEFLY